MTIRYTNFADGDVLTAEQLLEVQDNGVVQVTGFAELTSLEAGVNTAYVTGDSAFYVKKSDGSWGSVGGLATVSATAPATPVTGELWYDTDEVMPNMAKVTKAGSTTITASSFAVFPAFTAYSLTLPAACWVEISYGFTDGTGAGSADGVTVKVDVSGPTTYTTAASDYATSIGQTFGSAMNSYATVLNTGVNVITMSAKKNSTGATTCSNAWILIKPIRWS